MPKAYQLTLTEKQREELVTARNTHSKPYVRERASAILQVADGKSIRQVAQSGLLQRRRPEPVSEWIKRYLAEGLNGLMIKPGRGRKPSFFPSGQERG